jgi:hypothetical protein
MTAPYAEQRLKSKIAQASSKWIKIMLTRYYACFHKPTVVQLAETGIKDGMIKSRIFAG